jgi:NAD(P)-dependent dehydrogenase (short-subunit alcohol dehydrogenase family)
LPEYRTALVTEPARGIGRQVALALPNMATGSLPTTSRRRRERSKNSGPPELKHPRIPGDVSDETAVRGMVEAVMGEVDRIDVLVNNAGISTSVPAEDATLADWSRTLAVNLTDGFVPDVQGVRAGDVRTGLGEHRERELRRGSARDLRPGRVQCEQARFDRLDAHPRRGVGRARRPRERCLPGLGEGGDGRRGPRAGGYTDADIEDRVSMGRFAVPEDVARAVAFLADPEWSGFVNGHTLSVDGGWFGDGSWESLRRGKQGL